MRSPIASPHKDPVMRGFDGPVAAILNKPLAKQSSYRWFDTLWRSHDVTTKRPSKIVAFVKDDVVVICTVITAVACIIECLRCDFCLLNNELLVSTV